MHQSVDSSRSRGSASLSAAVRMMSDSRSTFQSAWRRVQPDTPSSVHWLQASSTRDCAMPSLGPVVDIVNSEEPQCLQELVAKRLGGIVNARPASGGQEL